MEPTLTIQRMPPSSIQSSLKTSRKGSEIIIHREHRNIQIRNIVNMRANMPTQRKNKLDPDDKFN